MLEIVIYIVKLGGFDYMTQLQQVCVGEKESVLRQ